MYILPDLVYSLSAAYTTPVCTDQQSSVFKQQLGTHLESSVLENDISFEITNLLATCSKMVGGAAEGGATLGSDEGARMLVRFDVVVKHSMLLQCSSRCMVGEMDQKLRLVSFE